MADIIVIGGGAAGIMAALTAAEGGADVLLLERNAKLGRKIYITGKGRCNVTNDCTVDEFMKEVPRNPRFLFSALNTFSPQDMMTLLEDNGCPVTVQRGRRVFPSTEKASDVTRTLEQLLRRHGVRICLETRVQRILTENGAVSGVRTEEGKDIPCRAVILASGGKSYPATGSTGDGYRIAGELGHTVTPLRASLSALVTEEEWPSRLQGLSLKNVSLVLKQGKKTLYTELGEMLFTHFGVSGPLVLTASCHLPEKPQDTELYLDLKPALDEQTLDARLVREMTAQSRKRLRTAMAALLPSSMAELFPEIAGLEGEKCCDQVTKEERRQLVQMLKALPLHIRSLRPIDEAIVTRGGISIREITPSTMESKLLPGLYFAGEVMDVDAHTGGYNLQIAWSTGRLAGMNAAENLF